MMLEELSSLIQREVSKIQEELGLYQNEEAIWKTSEGISNSAGNLALHVAGNLQHFIGSVLGGSGYVRQREAEFSSKNVPLADVLSELDKAKDAVASTLPDLSEEVLEADYPIHIFGGVKTKWFMLHLLSHTTYHLGQINYHRRILS